jgi:hypothetical protein
VGQWLGLRCAKKKSSGIEEKKKILLKKKIQKFQIYLAAQGSEAAEHIGTNRVGQWPCSHRKLGFFSYISHFHVDQMNQNSFHVFHSLI